MIEKILKINILIKRINNDKFGFIISDSIGKF